MNELLTMSVVEMAKKIREGELSPVAALEAHIARINEVNPKLNALVVSRFEEAKKEAQAAEERLKKSRDDLPPLFGVPCTVKDTYALKDYTWSAGLWWRRELIADFDAAVVERLKSAGAIIMGKTNVPEGGMWCETYNKVYGTTNNPYDLRRTVGGSSGGEGAIVAAAGSPFGIGSDIGGSIRYPSAFNGVAGHKPTGGMVPGTGHFPEIALPLGRVCAYGPLARRVDDLACLLPILAGPDGKDQAAEKRELKSPDRVDLDKLRVFFFDHNGGARAGAEVRRAVNLAAGALRAKKMAVEFWRPEGIELSLPIWQAAMTLNPEPFSRVLGGGEPLPLFRELFKLILRRSKVTFPALGAALIEAPNKIFKKRTRTLLALARDLRARIEDRLGDDGVIICPVFSQPAPVHHRIWLNFPGGIGYSGLFNVLEFPSTIIPVYHREDGVPVSVQVVAARWNDHLTLAAAKRLEEVFGGWKPKEKIG